MTRQFTQLRYIGANSEAISFESGSEWSNNLIDGKYVVQLGIYALPGTKFLLNQDNKLMGENLVINNTGIFQIDIEDRPITSLRLNKNSYENLSENSGHVIIIDLLYEGGVINA